MNHQVATGIRKSMEPWIKDEVEFYEHQITGIRQMMQMRNLLLADDMGLGKSLQAQTVAAGDIIRGWAEKILVVAPITLKSNWSDEFDKFTGIPHIILGQTIDHSRPPSALRRSMSSLRCLDLVRSLQTTNRS
jgi:N12 class adenine-specific DNA methylase